MRLLPYLAFPSILSIALTLSPFVFAGARCPVKNPHCNYDKPYIPSCDQLACCNNMGGISYCDSSASRYVCKNGSYSSCYCTRHAVMDLQKFEGCCLWQGGVLSMDGAGLVICNNGGISEICSLQAAPESISSW